MKFKKKKIINIELRYIYKRFAQLYNIRTKMPRVLSYLFPIWKKRYTNFAQKYVIGGKI